jgi:hypothetical protein
MAALATAVLAREVLRVLRQHRSVFPVECEVLAKRKLSFHSAASAGKTGPRLQPHAETTIQGSLDSGRRWVLDPKAAVCFGLWECRPKAVRGGRISDDMQFCTVL